MCQGWRARSCSTRNAHALLPAVFECAHVAAQCDHCGSEVLTCRNLALQEDDQARENLPSLFHVVPATEGSLHETTQHKTTPRIPQSQAWPDIFDLFGVCKSRSNAEGIGHPCIVSAPARGDESAALRISQRPRAFVAWGPGTPGSFNSASSVDSYKSGATMRRSPSESSLASTVPSSPASVSAWMRAEYIPQTVPLVL